MGEYTQIKNKERTKSGVLWILALLFAGFAACQTYRSTALYGAGLTPDSVGYIALAKDITHNGLSFLSENKAVEQPPLYPIVLGLCSTFSGIPIVNVAAWINVIASAALVMVILFSIGRVTTFIPVLIAAGIVSCFSIPLTHIWAMAWTEPLFILMISATVLIVTCPEHPASSIISASVLTTAACLTRYAGIVLIPVVSVFIIFKQSGTVWKRLRQVGVYAFLPTIMFALYIFRNHAVSGTLLGSRAPSRYGFAANIDTATHVVLDWFLPPRVHASEALLLSGAALFGAMVWSKRQQLIHCDSRAKHILTLSFLFGVAYMGFIALTSAITAYDRIDNRLLSPLFPSLLILLSVGVKPEIWRGRTTLFLALFVGFALFVPTPLRAAIAIVNGNFRNGAGGYNSRSWQESQIVNYFRRSGRQIEDVIFSNMPPALYMLVGYNTQMSPKRKNYNSEQSTGVTLDNLFQKHPDFDGALLVWFNRKGAECLFTPEDLSAVCDLVAIENFSDGTLYRVTKRQHAP